MLLKILETSILYRLLTSFFAWIGVKWHQSRIISWFLTPATGREISESSIISKLFKLLRNVLCLLFEKLRLNRLFKGSIFTQTFIWCVIPAVLAPFLPTMVVLCLVIVGVFSLLVRIGTSRALKLNNSPVSKYIVLFCFVYLIAALTSVSVSGSLYSSLVMILFALFALVFNQSFTSRRQIDFAVRLFVLAGTAVSLYGLYQYLFYDPANAGSWIDSDMFSDITNRVYSTLGNPNVLAEYLLLITPFAAACFINGKTFWQKALYLCCLAAMIVCMVVTYSRGGYIGLIFAAAIFIVMLDARFILVGLIALVALYFVLPQTVIERFASIGNMSDSSTSYRVYIWLGTIAMLKDYWLSGIGPGNAAFNLVYPAYGYNTISAPHAHNLYLQLMCDAGILGLLLFLLILFGYFRAAFSAFAGQRDKKARIYLIAAVSSVSGFLLQGMTDYSFYNNRVTLFFWVIIGLGAALVRRSYMEEGSLWSKS